MLFIVQSSAQVNHGERCAWSPQIVITVLSLHEGKTHFKIVAHRKRWLSQKAVIIKENLNGVMRLTEESLKGKNGSHYLTSSRDLQHRGGRSEGTITHLASPGLSLVLA